MVHRQGERQDPCRRRSSSGSRQDIFAGKVGTVVVWKLDRLSRRLRDGVNLLADWCERGLKIVVVTQQIELNGAVGRMIAALLLGLAEIELEYRAERQAAGIEVAKKKGIYKGRKKGTTKGEPEPGKGTAGEGAEGRRRSPRRWGRASGRCRGTWRRDGESKTETKNYRRKTGGWFHRGGGFWWS